VLVVLGANHELIAEKTKLEDTVVIINEQWQSGMASSIRAGIEILADDTRIDRALITLCDQPHVDHLLMKELVKKQQNCESAIVACSYGDTVGVPAVFSREMFPSLISLNGQEGARKLIASYPKHLETLAFSKGIIDIDTLADYQHLKDEDKTESGEI
jgi:molybdenum cofactor cytidylyltransferase